MKTPAPHHRAFSLIELLLVVTVIIIILAMLLPAISLSRKQVQTARCASNLFQLTRGWSTYAADNDARVIESWQANGGFQGGVGTHWYVALKPYYNHDKGLLPCPAADLRKTPVGAGGNRGTALDGWKVYTSPASHAGVETNDYGGYGLNNWLEDGKIVGPGIGAAMTNFINRISANGVPHRNVPVLADGVWPDQGWPRETDTMPPDLIDPEPYGASGWMRRYFLDRHNKAINLSFMDGSTRLVPHEQMWSLQWHRTFVTR